MISSLYFLFESFEDRPSGWPVLQYRVLHELMYSADRMGNPHVAVRSVLVAGWVISHNASV